MKLRHSRKKVNGSGVPISPPPETCEGLIAHLRNRAYEFGSHILYLNLDELYMLTDTEIIDLAEALRRYWQILRRVRIRLSKGLPIPEYVTTTSLMRGITCDTPHPTMPFSSEEIAFHLCTAFEVKPNNDPIQSLLTHFNVQSIAELARQALIALAKQKEGTNMTFSEPEPNLALEFAEIALAYQGNHDFQTLIAWVNTRQLIRKLGSNRRKDFVELVETAKFFGFTSKNPHQTGTPKKVDLETYLHNILCAYAFLLEKNEKPILPRGESAQKVLNRAQELGFELTGSAVPVNEIPPTMLVITASTTPTLPTDSTRKLFDLLNSIYTRIHRIALEVQAVNEVFATGLFWMTDLPKEMPWGETYSTQQALFLELINLEIQYATTLLQFANQVDANVVSQWTKLSSFSQMILSQLHDRVPPIVWNWFTDSREVLIINQIIDYDEPTSLASLMAKLTSPYHQNA